MESLENIIDKIEAPIVFASRDSYKHLSRITNLEKVMIALLRHLKEEIKHSETLSQNNELNATVAVLLDIFNGYDSLSQQQRMDRLEQSFPRLSELKILLKKNPMMEETFGQSYGGEMALTDPHALSRSVESVRGVGPKIAALLAKKNIHTVEDLLFYLPRRYEDRRSVSRITDTVHGMKQTVIGRIFKTETRYLGKKKVFCALIDDGSEILKALWFNKGRETFLKGILKPQTRLILTGKISGLPFEREMIHPDYEIMENQDDQLLNFKRIVPFYPETEGIHQKTMRRIIWKLVRDVSHLVHSPIPDDFCRKRHLMEIKEAVHNVHFPAQNQNFELYMEMRSEAHRRLVYEEFFISQLGMALRKSRESLATGISFKTNGEMVKRFYALLSFTLTDAQKRVISEIERDMSESHCMRRLLQGDVGSGKTVVAMAAMVNVCENGYQSAIMAPTEILAEQHYRNLKKWGQELGLRVAILTSGIKPAERVPLLNSIQKGGIDMVIGTHSLIQEGVNFRNLGFVVIDEQHRFGVVQRAMLLKKVPIPDVLVMTATPIPRTFAMAAYGDLDYSVIDEMPPGKIPVRTKVFNENQREHVYKIIRGEVQKGNQVYIVYPLAEASDKIDLRDATRMAAHLQHETFPDYRVGLVHGQMKGIEKNKVMNNFYRKEIQILVSTTVIEVGIDIPNVSLIVIEHAERFGLSQLHQLRGRVGRGEKPGLCVLMMQESDLPDAAKRLSIMEQTNDGFRIAEEDLAIRGPGEIMGTKQSGLPDFRIADIIRDANILYEAKTDAFDIINKDNCLSSLEHRPLMDVLIKRWGGRLDFADIG